MNKRQSPRFTRPSAVTASAAVTVLALASCGFFGGDDEDNVSEEDRFLSTMNDAVALENELTDAENRYMRQCMSDEGFDVHDPFELRSWDVEASEALVEHYPGSDVMLSAEQAEEEAFGAWKSAPESDYDGDDDEPDTDLTGEMEAEIEEFRSQSDTYKWDYYIALMGLPWTEHSHPHLDPEVGEITEENEGDFFNEEPQPEPEGCKGDMIDAVYNGGQMVTEEIDGNEYTYFSYRPELPTSSTWEEKTESFQTDEVVQTQISFEDCLADKGLSDWTFDENGNIDPNAYFFSMYFNDGGQTSGDWYSGPEPDSSLTGYEEIREHEFEVAGHFADCNEETGAGEVMHETWLEIELEEIREMESEIHSWTDQMEDHLADVQGLLAE